MMVMRPKAGKTPLKCRSETYWSGQNSLTTKNDDSCANLLYKFAEDTKLSRSIIYGLETDLGPLEIACLEVVGRI